MPARRIVPCLDVKNGRVVKGVQFRDLRDLGTPVELARRYDREGADELVFLDIAATEEQRGTQLAWVREVARELSIPFTVGGGVKSVDDVRRLLRAGADKVAINSAAVKEPALLEACAREFGSQCVVLACDVARDDALGWRVFTGGGKQRTDRAGVPWIREAVALGAGEVLLTSIDRDGTQQGFDLELLRALEDLSVPLIASGGAGEKAHFLAALQVGADAVLAASLFHESRLPIAELKRFLAERGQLIRS
ncbi:MAG: imidazole glycerol phosphate synthase subunit HisF [Deltaproteobacteria bacterium]|nr:imidazole glycerol phosphate synthase subunit HisF [Deltaproteobacteria bacterium]